MNLLDNHVSRAITSLYSNWIDSYQFPNIINTVTYDLYESNNPLRHHFDDDEIKNDNLRRTVNATTMVGAEFFSVLTNPYYLTHKIIRLPYLYSNAVETYKKFASSISEEEEL